MKKSITCKAEIETTQVGFLPTMHKLWCKTCGEKILERTEREIMTSPVQAKLDFGAAFAQHAKEKNDQTL